MTTRKRLVFYHFCLFAGMCGTLFATAPALAPPVIVWGCLYLAGLVPLYLLGYWQRMGRAAMRRRAPLAILGMVALWLAMTAIAGPGPGVFALLLSVWSLWPRRMATTVP